MNIEIGKFYNPENLDTPNVRVATISDAQGIYDLLEYKRRNGSEQKLKYRDIPEIIDLIQNQYSFFVLDSADRSQLEACASMDVFEHADISHGIPGLAELRSCAARYEGIGLGQKVIWPALQRAKLLGVKVFATTDNPHYYEKYGFETKKEGSQLLWVNKGGILKTAQLYPTGIFDIPKDEIEKKETLSLMKNNTNILQMSDGEYEYRMSKGNIYVYKLGGKILGAVAAIAYGNGNGRKSRMAEIRGLTLTSEHQGTDLDLIMLNKCKDRFKDADVAQAFITVMPEMERRYMASGLFTSTPGYKHVVWWNGVIPDGIISNNISAPFV